MALYRINEDSQLIKPVVNPMHKRVLHHIMLIDDDLHYLSCVEKLLLRKGERTVYTMEENCSLSVRQYGDIVFDGSAYIKNKKYTINTYETIFNSYTKIISFENNVKFYSVLGDYKNLHISNITEIEDHEKYTVPYIQKYIVEGATHG